MLINSLLSFARLGEEASGPPDWRGAREVTVGVEESREGVQVRENALFCLFVVPFKEPSY